MKIFLYRTLLDYCQHQGIEHLEWLPETFVIYPTNASVDETLEHNNIQQLKATARLQKDERRQLESSFINDHQKIWIAKSSNGAKGISLRIDNVLVIKQSNLLHFSFCITQYVMEYS